MTAPKGTIRHSTLNSLRDAYAKAWDAPWPFDNDYLAELWRETRAATTNERGNQRLPWDDVRRFCLDLMRECHARS